MSVLNSGKFWVRIGITLAVLGILQQIWHWEVERIEVPAGEYLVRIHRWGKNLPSDQIVAPDPSYKGVMLDVLPEGRHFLNPIFWSYERHRVVDVPKGKCLVLTRKFGREIPADRIARGEVLAQHDPAQPFAGERGVVRDVLGPGSYRLNPYAYSWEEHNAVQVDAREVGVRALLIGQDSSQSANDSVQGRYVVSEGSRGIQKSTLSNGTYYINPYVESISTVEVQAHRVELSDIVFPSRDGFMMKPVVVVEYSVLPDRTPEMLVRLSDIGQLHQRDSTPAEQAENEILQKVILPHIRGYARIEGSNFFARDFITTESATQAVAALDDAAQKAAQAAKTPVEKQGNPAQAGVTSQRVANARERMQQAMFNKVKEPCRELGVDVRAVVIADMPPPEELASQIGQRELAKVELAKNASVIRQFRAQQSLDAAKALKEQARQKVGAETRLIQAKTRANQIKEVAESQLKQELDNAQVALEASKKQAEAQLTTARAEVAVIDSQNTAEVAGLQTAVQGFSSPRHFAQFHVISKLAPTLREIFAADDSDFAKIFSNYMSPQAPAANGPQENSR